MEHVNEPSEGEIFIREFLADEGIKVETEVRLPPLKNDSKSFRIADFYLPGYKVYIEFLGRWNRSEEDRNKYKEKIKVYEQNRIPCMFIYPENLGIIHYTFRYRLRQILRKHNMAKELLRFNLYSLLNDRIGTILWLVIVLCILVGIVLGKRGEYYYQSIVLLTFIAIFQLYRIYSGYVKYFKKGYSYVTFMRE
jgi:hypothetical protein